MSKPTHIDELIKCAERELKRRETNYPLLVKQNKMTQEKADHEIRLQDQIVRTMDSFKILVEGKKFRESA